MKKVLYFSLFLFIFCILFSPFLSFAFPDKFRDHVYFRLAYNVIVNNEIQGVMNKSEKFQKIFDYVVNHEFAQGNPYKCKPFESLVFAEAYCDFQARTLNVLLAAAGIKSRYAILLDENGISPHTLNEVFLDGKWCAVDTSSNIILKDYQGKALPLEELTNNPNLILNDVKLATLREYNNVYYESLRDWYLQVFSSRAHPIRSKPDIQKTHIIDWISDIYYGIFKDKFLNLYQDIYLKLKDRKLVNDDFKLFYLARNYHLFGRADLALRYYSELLTMFPDSIYGKDALFFIGMFYFEMKKDYGKAIYYFKMTIDKDSGKWGKSAYYYLGKAYSQIGNHRASISAYNNANIARLSQDILRSCLKIP